MKAKDKMPVVVPATAALAAAVLARQALVDGKLTTASIWFNAVDGRMLPRRIDPRKANNDH